MRARSKKIPVTGISPRSGADTVEFSRPSHSFCGSASSSPDGSSPMWTRARKFEVAPLNWLIGIFQGINDSALADNIRGTVWVFPTIETIHVVAIVLVFGSITRLDLRLLGLVWTNRAVTEVAEEMLPFTWVAFVIAAVLGLLLWSSKPLTYFGIVFRREDDSDRSCRHQHALFPAHHLQERGAVGSRSRAAARSQTCRRSIARNLARRGVLRPLYRFRSRCPVTAGGIGWQAS